MTLPTGHPDAQPPHAVVNADGTLAQGPHDLAGLPAEAAAVARVLGRLGAAGRVRGLDPAAGTSPAAALGVPDGAVVVPVVLLADGAPVLVLVSGLHRVDLLAVAAVVGAQDVHPADAGRVRSVTGQDPDAVAPVGHAHPMRTVVDVALARHDVVWAPAGAVGWVFPTTYDELLRITAAEAAEVGEGYV